jgi:hypothetical protein
MSIIVKKKVEAIAIISPPQAKQKSWLGSMKDSIQVTGDIISPVADEDECEFLRD